MPKLKYNIFFLILFVSLKVFSICLPGELHFSGATIRLDNDSITGTDRDYTHGLIISAESEILENYAFNGCLPLPLRLHKNLIQYFTPDWFASPRMDPAFTATVKVGQAMYTPSALERRDLIVNDRPYAGIFYAGLGINQSYQKPPMDILDSQEIVLGVIGPAALAKEFQDAAHDFYGDRRFDGWSHQLHNEPAAQVTMTRKVKIRRDTGLFIPGFSGDYVKSFGASIGNIETSAKASLETRVGNNIPNNFGNSLMMETSSNAAAIPSGIYLFTILEAKIIWYDFSLDGNIWQSSHSVARRTFVGTGAIGLSAQIKIDGSYYRFSIMDVYRTLEFDEQESPHAYGSVALASDF